MKRITILAFETSCDETSVAILREKNEVLANLVLSQIDIHKIFGGVVPEIAARKHLEYLYALTEKALEEANLSMKEIDAIAVTHGPGLVGSLLIGLNFAKALAFSYNKPFIAVNHLIGHIYANFLAFEDLKPPFLNLLVSGGHTMLILVKDWFEFEVLGRSVDDAVGEAFDKVARILELGYPGGPEIEELAKNGKAWIDFPKPMIEKGYDFSFSGLKTSVLYFMKKNPQVKKEDIAASFQETIVEILYRKTIKAAKDFKMKKIVIAGGVAANSRLRERFALQKEFEVFYPPLNLCTDNALMVAKAALKMYEYNMFSDLNIDAQPSLEI